jgi:arsenate reductase
MTAHWGFPDPSHIEGDDEAKRLAFNKAAQTIAHRLRLFLSLPVEKLDRISLQQELRRLGDT